jgi:hypothetical protein
MSTTAVLFDIEKAFDTTRHYGLPNKLSELEFSTSLTKLIVCFLTDRKFKPLEDGEVSARRKIAAGVPQDSVLTPIFYNLYIRCNLFGSEKFNNTSLFRTHFYVRRHLDRLLCCRYLSHDNQINSTLAGRFNLYYNTTNIRLRRYRSTQ